MPSVVQYAQSEPGSGLTSPQTIALSGTTAGNMLVLVQMGGFPTGYLTPNAPTDTLGNTWIACGASSGLDGSSPKVWVGMYYAVNRSSGSTTVSTTWTGTTAGYVAFYLFEVSGVNTYDTGAIGSTNGTPTTTNPNVSTFNVNYSGEIVLAATLQGNTATGAGSGFTLITITTNYEDCLEYALPSAGTITPTAVADGSSQNWYMTAGGFYYYSPPTPPATTSGLVVSAAGW